MNKAVLESGYWVLNKKGNLIVKPINTFMRRILCMWAFWTPPSIIHEHLSVTKYCVLCCLILDHIFLFLSNLWGESIQQQNCQKYYGKGTFVMGKNEPVIKLKFVGENSKFKEIYLKRGLKLLLRLNNRPAAQ